MKKALSILISVMMVAGLFVALVPTASAAEKPGMVDTGLLVYHQDFEDESYAELTDHDLTKALGWIQDEDIADDPNTTYSEASIKGIDNAGTAAIAYDEEAGNNSIYMTFGTGGDGYGWAFQIVDNPRLQGGDYVIEWTQTLTADTNASFGVGFRNGTAWAQTSSTAGLNGYDLTNIFTWGTNFKFAINKQANSEVKYGNARMGNYNSDVIKVFFQANGIDYTTDYANNQTITDTYTYRTVVSSTQGIHSYIMINGEWVYYVGSDDIGTACVQEHADQITSGLNMLLRNNVQTYIDDISVWTIADENQVSAEIVGYQTAAGAEGTKDVRIVGKVANLTATDVVAEVRYEICIDEETWADVWLENAYKEITASYGAEAYVAGDGELYTALHVTGCPVGTSFSVTPYVTFADGATLIGEAMDFVVA